MGRAEAPLERDGTAPVEIAYWLRDLRRTAGLTYSEIALLTNYAASSLQGACSGRRIPSRKITMAIVAACAGDLPAWADYWSRLQRMAAQGGQADLHPPWWPAVPVPVPVAVPAVVPAVVSEPAPVAASEPVAVAEPVPVLVPVSAVVVEPPIHRADGAPVAGVVGRAVERPPNRWSLRRLRPARHRRRLGWLSSVAASFAVGMLAGHLLDASPATARDTAAPARGPVWERESNQNGAPSVTDPRAPVVSGPGVPFGEPVQVSCELRVRRDGSEIGWYRVASRPWTGGYVPAPDFTALATGTAVPTC